MLKRLAIAIVILAALNYLALTWTPADPRIAEAEAAVFAMRADLSKSPVNAADASTTDLRPNIVLIVADDLGWRDVGYNHSDIRTPHMDRLAASGMTLNRFYAQPSCSPTRAALLTGRAPIRLGIVDPLSKNNPTGLPLSETTLADRLRAAGYQTILTGKWHLGARSLAYHPNARGFDHFYGHLTGAVGYYSKIHGGGYDWQRNGTTVREDGYTTHLITREAVQMIKGRDPDRPFFLYAAYGAPHLPNEAPQDTIDAYSDIGNERRRIHAAMVTELDAAVGALYATLESEGIANRTLIWFLSDNGGLYPTSPVHLLPAPLFKWAAEARMGTTSTPKMLEFLRRNLGNGGADNQPFKGKKGDVAEGGVRVPAFLHWPGTLNAGSHYNYMTTVQDVLPTLMTIAGAPVPADAVDGTSLWAALQRNAPGKPTEYIVQTERIGRFYGVYRYPYKLVIEEAAPTALYNLEADPLEDTNLLDHEPAVAADLAAYFAAFPKGERVLLPLEETIRDPDFFGGEEDRAPWADQAYAPDAVTLSDAVHRFDSSGAARSGHIQIAGTATERSTHQRATLQVNQKGAGP